MQRMLASKWRFLHVSSSELTQRRLNCSGTRYVYAAVRAVGTLGESKQDSAHNSVALCLYNLGIYSTRVGLRSLVMGRNEAMIGREQVAKLESLTVEIQDEAGGCQKR